MTVSSTQLPIWNKLERLNGAEAGAGAEAEADDAAAAAAPSTHATGAMIVDDKDDDIELLLLLSGECWLLPSEPWADDKGLILHLKCFLTI